MLNHKENLFLNITCFSSKFKLEVDKENKYRCTLYLSLLNTDLVLILVAFAPQVFTVYIANS